MSDIFKDVAAFHDKYGLKRTEEPRTSLPEALMRFRMDFIREEHDEFMAAVIREEAALIALSSFECVSKRAGLGQVQATNALWGLATDARADQLDAIIDMIYVLVGYADLRGWDLETAWQLVHQVNMTQKRRAMPEEGRSEWDVVKLPTYKKPFLCNCV